MSSAAPLRTQAAKLQPTSNASHAGLLLQRKCACGSPTASLAGECAECASKKRLQTKLTIGASDDPLEREADRVVDQVMAAPAHSPVRGAPPHIQRYTAQSGKAGAVAPASVDRVLASPGKPLEPALRQDMESRFGYDFSRVRVHSGGVGEQSARQMNARAYTVGHSLVFGEGQYSPGTSEGQRLIAHELTHIVQQSDKDINPRIQCKEENNAPLAAIQGLPMHDLLTRLNQLPESILDDEEAGGLVGGPRLTIAMRVVKSKKQKDIYVLPNNKDGIEALPADQAADILRFLGLPDTSESEKTINADMEVDITIAPSNTRLLGEQRANSQQGEIQAPELESTPEVPPRDLPKAFADPKNNSDFIDRRLIAVGVGLSGTDFILFCEGIDNPIALPINYIDLVTTRSIPVDQVIYPSREEALTHVPFGPPAPGGSSQFAYYRAIGGLVVPTTFSPTSAPETVKLILAAREKLRGLIKEITDTLVQAVLELGAAKLVSMVVNRWILKRAGHALKKLREAEADAMRTKSAPQGNRGAAQPEPPMAKPEPSTAPKGSETPKGEPSSGEQLELFPELAESAPLRPIVPQSAGGEPTGGRLPRVDVGEIKSVQAEKAGWRQVNGRKFTHRIPDSGHEAVITYDGEGNIRAKVRISGGDERIIFDEIVGKLPKEQMPSAKYGTKAFGDAIEDPIRVILESQSSVGQKFIIKSPSGTGPDILPHQPSLPVPH